VVSLVARGAFEGLGLPLAAGGATLSAVDPGPVTSLAPFAGRVAEVEAALGAALPPPGRAVSLGAGRMLWTGPGRALLVGLRPPEGLDALAAMVPQGDGIAAAALEGPAAREVLARLVPLDLRDRAFPVGATARTLLGHMTITLTRLAPEAWEILAMRSMAVTVARELAEAMQAVAARDVA
jgi:sarcosine oxidase subunit gamma